LGCWADKRSFQLDSFSFITTTNPLLAVAEQDHGRDLLQEPHAAAIEADVSIYGQCFGQMELKLPPHVTHLLRFGDPPRDVRTQLSYLTQFVLVGVAGG
jgi:hypothetical protein